MDSLLLQSVLLSPKIKKLIERIVASKISNQDDRLDVIQNIYLKAWIGLKRYIPQGRFPCWISVISYREVFTFLRFLQQQKKRMYDSTLYDSAEPVYESDDGFNRQLVMLEAYDDSVKEFKSSNVLDIKQQVLESYFLDYRSKRSIARQLGISITRVSKIIKTFAHRIYNRYNEKCDVLEEQGIQLE